MHARSVVAEIDGGTGESYRASGAAAAPGEVEVVEARRLGGAWVLDRLWKRVAIAGLGALTSDAAYAGMDFLLDALGEIASEVFAQVAHLLNLDLDIIFAGMTSTHVESDVVGAGGDDDVAPAHATYRRQAARAS